MPTAHTKWRLQGIRSKNIYNNLHQVAIIKADLNVLFD